MASDYHPFYSTLWNDEKLEGACFEGKAFFGYLFTNHRVRPSGIYRATDEQLASDTGVPVRRVHGYLADLHARRLIVRDGAWIFVVSYFKRQPKGDNILRGVESDIKNCSSMAVLRAFFKKYPLHSRPSIDFLEEAERRSNGFLPTEQLQLQSRAEQSNTSGSSPDIAPLTAVTTTTNGHEHGPAAMRTAARQILDFLNAKAGRHFQPVPPTLDLIIARLRGGATVDQCLGVVAAKVREWKGDAKMQKFLRPETLFDAKHFASYQGELPAEVFARDA